MSNDQLKQINRKPATYLTKSLFSPAKEKAMRKRLVGMVRKTARIQAEAWRFGEENSPLVKR